MLSLFAAVWAKAKSGGGGGGSGVEEKAIKRPFMSHMGAREYCNLWITATLAKNGQTRESGLSLASFGFSNDHVPAVFCPPLTGGTWQPDEGQGGPRRGAMHFLHTGPRGWREDAADGCQRAAGPTSHILVQRASCEAPWERLTLVSNAGLWNWASNSLLAYGYLCSSFTQTSTKSSRSSTY